MANSESIHSSIRWPESWQIVYYKQVLTYLLPYDFGYGWVWNYGHLYAALFFGAVASLLRNRIPRWAVAALGALSLYAFTGFLIVQFGFRFNLPQLLPTGHFLSNTHATDAPVRVLDMGSGSGRTTVMVFLARPGVRVTALDNFSADYIAGNGPERLKRNVRAAGVDDSRVDVVASDMRKMSLPDASFDGIVSSYAIDHLDRAGIASSLHEASRVLKPNGEFLLSIIAMDGWLKTVYGPLLLHHVRRVSTHFWEDSLREAGLRVTEQGRQPGSRWFLCRKI